MTLIAAALALIGGIILLTRLFYLSRNFSRRITQISSGMTRLAHGDDRFAIEGHDREDEIGDMVKSLESFTDAHRQLEVWAYERAEAAEAELRAKQEREKNREKAEQRRSSTVKELARDFQQSVGDVVQIEAVASIWLHAGRRR